MFDIACLALREHDLGSKLFDVAITMSNLAANLDGLKKYDAAIQLYRRSIEILEAAVGPVHRDVAMNLNNLAATQGNEALATYQRALGIKEQALGPDHADLATTLNNLALVQTELGRFDEASHNYAKSLRILQETFGAEHPLVVDVRASYLAMLRSAKKEDEAERLR